jgi:hypothetical protein
VVAVYSYLFSVRVKLLGPQRGERSSLSSCVNVYFKPCEGMIEGEPIISWLHNVCVPVTPYFSHTFPIGERRMAVPGTILYSLSGCPYLDLEAHSPLRELVQDGLFLGWEYLKLQLIYTIG